MNSLFGGTFEELGELLMIENKYNVPCGFWRKPGNYLCTVAVSFYDGVAYESDSEWGYCHFLEHVHFKRTEHLKNFFAIASSIEKLGGQISAFTTRNSITYWIQVPRWEIDRAFYVLQEILLNNEFVDEDVESEKKLINEEILREKNNPRFYNKLYLEEVLLKHSPLGRHPLGSSESINDVNPEKLIKFKSNGYGRKNMYIAVTGDIDIDIISKKIDSFLELFEDGRKKDLRIFKDDCINSKEETEAYILDYKGNKHTNMAIGWNVPSLTEQEKVTWKVLNSVLGVGFSSILFQKLREEYSLTYLVKTSLRFYQNNNTWRMDMDISEKNIPKAISEINKIMLNLSDKGIPEGYFNMAKKMYWNKIVSELIDGLKSAKWMSQSINTYGKVMTLKDVALKINSVNNNDITNLVQKYILSNKKAICISGSSDKILEYFNGDNISIIKNY